MIIHVEILDEVVFGVVLFVLFVELFELLSVELFKEELSTLVQRVLFVKV